MNKTLKPDGKIPTKFTQTQDRPHPGLEDLTPWVLSEVMMKLGDSNRSSIMGFVSGKDSLLQSMVFFVCFVSQPHKLILMGHPGTSEEED